LRRSTPGFGAAFARRAVGARTIAASAVAAIHITVAAIHITVAVTGIPRAILRLGAAVPTATATTTASAPASTALVAAATVCGVPFGTVAFAARPRRLAGAGR
jgi:hypothetical protein